MKEAVTHVLANASKVLEMNRERLRRMRGELRPIEGPTYGASLARMGELAMRLDNARLGLGTTIDSARAAAAAREAERLDARKDQESAEKLERAAIGVAEELAERKLRQAGRRSPRLQETGEQE